MKAGRLQERIAIDRELRVSNGAGGATVSWIEQFQAAAEFRYERGGEAEEAGALTGSAMFKVVLRSSTGSRGITAKDSLRDTRRSVRYNIREVDAISDRAYVWLKVESGVAGAESAAADAPTPVGIGAVAVGSTLVVG